MVNSTGTAKQNKKKTYNAKQQRIQKHHIPTDHNKVYNRKLKNRQHKITQRKKDPNPMTTIKT
jgi:hypothetical protein